METKPARPEKFELRQCYHLGERIPGEPCGSPLIRCKLHRDITTRFYKCEGAARCCKDCKRSQFVPRPNDPRAGVAIGSFRWPELIEVQIKTIRETCGPVPILVSNDDPESREALAAICSRFPDVDLDSNPERIGHTGGDIAVFYKGIRWGAERGLEVVAKLSQRFILNRSRWLHDTAGDLLESGLPMGCRRCRGAAPFDLRTEAVFLDVQQWNRPGTLERIKPRKYWDDLPEGLPAEKVIFEAFKELGGVMWPIANIMSEDRYSRDYPDILWHCNTGEPEFRALAESHGVTLPEGFHVGGWDRELSKGTYSYG